MTDEERMAMESRANVERMRGATRSVADWPHSDIYNIGPEADRRPLEFRGCCSHPTAPDIIICSGCTPPLDCPLRYAPLLIRLKEGV